MYAKSTIFRDSTPLALIFPKLVSGLGLDEGKGMGNELRKTCEVNGRGLVGGE